ncbi:purine-nucleoside phosphorylase [Robiginitalea sp. M366]|uniref:purine-nucleoside phosphorylase n=1 Tax=Robiginitalea aestuariiviva TaxID=3036903 RepID=UPI00240D607C|nr:purine-nucleoside phosphorylase [Robiginitalea aestuariiviva]MDG1571856.1 purine-nucleoside phosphorylase [Robiginitalea aestuariiviva]
MTKKQLETSVAFLKEKGFDAPEVGIVLGSGLGRMVEEIEDPKIVHYHNIPFFPLATVEFHSGKLLYGQIAGKKVVVMQGRFHLYEGYAFTDITYPIRVMRELGIRKLLISNAAGAINLDYRKGDLMLVEDHLNLQGGSPLAFKNVSDFGERFVDMSQPYDAEMCARLEGIAAEQGITLHKGVYAAVVGPQLETRAEYRMLGTLGADAVGMSTVPEVIVAKHLNLPVVAISVLTDECNPDHLEPVNVAEILAVAGKAEPKLVSLYKTLISEM